MADEPDNESGVKAYLPPSGPQNAHMVPYEWRGNQGVHSVGTYTVESPEGIIVTADRDAHRQLDNMNLESIPDDDAQKVLDAMREDDDSTVASIVEDHRSATDSSGSEQSESAESSEGSQSSEQSASDIPEDLDSLDYRELQDLAQRNNIRATQSAEELRTALSSVRAGDGIPDGIDTADGSDPSESSEGSQSSGGSEQSASAYQEQQGNE